MATFFSASKAPVRLDTVIDIVLTPTVKMRDQVDKAAQLGKKPANTQAFDVLSGCIVAIEAAMNGLSVQARIDTESPSANQEETPKVLSSGGLF